MKLGSACSGIGCIDLGLERAGFEPAWQIEINSQCRSVLARHWPDVPRFEDLKDATDLPRVDLIAGGTPCQDLSVAGKGAGLDGERSGVFFDFVRLADNQPWAFILWENVAGAFSTNAGRDFAVVLEGFAGVGFEVPPDGWRNAGVAYGPLRWVVWWCADAQYFGVPQRRRRIYLVAGPRGRCGPEVLLEPKSVCGDLAAGGEAGEGAATLTAGSPGSGRQEDDKNSLTGALQTTGPGGGWRIGADEAAGGQVVTSTLASHGTGGGYRLDDREARGNQIVTAPLTARGHRQHDQRGAEELIVVDETQITSRENRSNPKPGDPAPSLAGTARQIAYQCHGSNVGPIGALRSGHNEGGGVPFTVAATLRSGGAGGMPSLRGEDGHCVLDSVGKRQLARPRRLTPVEVEKLQGLPDNWTAWTADGQELADGPRYRMVGNGAAVPHVEWIGRRLIEAMRKESA